MPFSLFAASLLCPTCGNVAQDPSSIWMQTRLPKDEGSQLYQPGDAIEIVPPEAAGYLPLKPWMPGEPLRVLEAWGCPNCGHEPNWAEVTIADGLVQSIAPVTLDDAALDRAHYLTPEMNLYYEQITGEPLYVNGKPRPDFAEMLRRSLRDKR